VPDFDRLGSLRDDIAIVGVGDTDYALDHKSARDGSFEENAYGYAARAFSRAVTDCGIDRSAIDGLVVGPSLAIERTGEIIGIDPRWAAQGDAVNAILHAANALHSGMATCVALVYGNDQRSVGTQYGGPQAMGGENYLSYVYYQPWGLTSQGALYALMTNRYMELTGFGAADLAEVSMAQRRFAQLNLNALMREPLTLDKYLGSRFICEPLRLFDYCLINDGGVALIMTTADRARSLLKQPILIRGIGRSDTNRGATSLWPRLIDFYHTSHKEAASQVFEMAGIGPKDVDILEVYDSFSSHIVFALEGFGFCPMGEVAAFLKEQGIGPGGRLPINTSGGHLSESYMQGWNHQVDAVRQLRGEAGPRQVAGARHAQYISDIAGKVITVLYRGAYS
jgi:acetyl-CoA acetyltransferase